MGEHIAERLLYALDKEYPHARHVCAQYIAKHRELDSPCLIPAQVIHGFLFARCLSSHIDFQSGANLYKRIGKLSSQIHALSNWRYTRSIYRFDETLYSELIHQPLYIIPTQILYDLPESSMYIETQPNIYTLNGFFAHFERNETGDSLILTFIGKETNVLSFPISGKGSIAHIVKDMLSALPVQNALTKQDYFATRCKQALNLLLYLCCQNVDYSGQRPPSREKCREAKKATRYRKIGYIVGAEMRHVSQTKNRAGGYKMRPHIRRAHWHTYYVGKRGEQKPVLNWIEPIFVHKARER